MFRLNSEFSENQQLFIDWVNCVTLMCSRLALPI